MHSLALDHVAYHSSIYPNSCLPFGSYHCLLLPSYERALVGVQTEKQEKFPHRVPSHYRLPISTSYLHAFLLISSHQFNALGDCALWLYSGSQLTRSLSLVFLRLREFPHHSLIKTALPYIHNHQVSWKMGPSWLFLLLGSLTDSSVCSEVWFPAQTLVKCLCCVYQHLIH